MQATVLATAFVEPYIVTELLDLSGVAGFAGSSNRDVHETAYELS